MISEQELRRWVRELRDGRRTMAAVVRELRHPPIENLGFARLDTHRRLRRGHPEAIFCEGKTPGHILQLVRRFMRLREAVLLTRLDPLTAQMIQERLPRVRYDPIARIGSWFPAGKRQIAQGLTIVTTGGTADLPIAEEAAQTLEFLGSRVVRLYDVGVAGVHRVLGQASLLQRARVIVVAAGMEGALVSVVAGLVGCPVVALPTSVGYGANFQGISPLLTMLNSCVPGVGVVNIDNGFGAGYLAHVINCPPRGRQRIRKASRGGGK